MDGEYNCIMTAYGYNRERGMFYEYQQGSRRWRSYRDGIKILTDDVTTDAVSRSPVRLPQSELPSHRQATSVPEGE